MRNRLSSSLFCAANTVSLAVTAATFSNTLTAQEIQLEEVLVTAQKRTQSAQDVPVALTAISASMIEKNGINQTMDLVKLTPSLTMGLSDNKQSSSFALRGIGTNVYSIGVEQSVAVMIDDVSTVQAGQSLANLSDIERIEVLRGPQSTLFGKSASAGVISVITKAPAEELEGSIELTATDDDEEKVLASISGPITDTLAYRLSGYWSDRDGFVDNVATGKDVNDEENKGVRGKFQWDITDNIQTVLTAYYSESESTISSPTWLELDPDAQFLGFIPGAIAPGITPSDENLDYGADDGPSDETDSSGGSLRFNVGMGDFTLTSITAVDEWQYKNNGDLDFSTVDVYGFFTGGAVSGGSFSQSDTETDFVSQEFRLSSPSYDKFDYLLGLYFADADTDRSFLRNPDLAFIPSNWDATAGTTSAAIFGQSNWHLTDSTDITLGLRWNYEEISVDFNDRLLDPANPVSGDDTDSVILGNLSLQHFFTDDIMFYARYASGYKGQAFDISTGFTQLEADNPVDPETSDSFELGLKSTLLNNRLQLNLTAFYTEYDDFQAQSSVITPAGELVASLDNVGTLETQGLELEGVALLAENLTLTFGASYVDASIEDYKNAECYEGQTEALGCIDDSQDISGGTLPVSPDWKFNIMADYRAEFERMPFYGFFNLSYVWQDEVQYSLNQNPLTIQDSYGFSDLSIGINERANDRYRFTFFVNNLTDENYRSGIADLRNLYGGSTALVNSFARNSQRYYGLRAKFAF